MAINAILIHIFIQEGDYALNVAFSKELDKYISVALKCLQSKFHTNKDLLLQTMIQTDGEEEKIQINREKTSIYR